MDFARLWEEITLLVDQSLDAFLPAADQEPTLIHEAMRYSVFAGGKRIRPLLLILTTRLFSEKWIRTLPPACALELIHTYSLIHDDLPAMDDDDYRRGKPTAHRVYGEGMAILCGDALLTLAFGLLCGGEDLNNEIYQAYVKEVPPLLKLRITGEIAAACGVKGMIAGQVLDLEAEGQIHEIKKLDQINRLKTGALITAAVRCGALLGEAPTDKTQLLTNFASLVGRGFQVVDDLLDVEGNEQKMGKQKGMDQRRNKATIVSLYGLEQAKVLRDKLFAEAFGLLAPFNGEADALRKLTRFVFYRDY